MNEKNMLFYIKYKMNYTNNFKYESNELLKLNNKYVKSSSLMKSIVCIAKDIMTCTTVSTLRKMLIIHDITW